MANTANSQEPTMEEILASIRRIISEDGDSPKAEDAETAEAAAPNPQAEPEPAPEEPEDVLELTDVVPEEDEPPVVEAPEAESEDDVVMVERSTMKSAPKAPVVTSRPSKEGARDHGLISDEVRERASSSFMQLSRDQLVSETSPADPRSLEALVQDMLRPALEDWLNQNLPSIVERLVQQEIDRVSKKGGRF